MRSLPFVETKLTTTMFKRQFSPETKEEMVWHQDPEDRVILINSGVGWLFQIDNKLPIVLVPGQTLMIPKLVWHRLLVTEGATNLVVTINKIR